MERGGRFYEPGTKIQVNIIRIVSIDEFYVEESKDDNQKLTHPLPMQCSLYMPNIPQIKFKKMIDILSQSFRDELDMSKDMVKTISIVQFCDAFVVELYVDNLNVSTIIEPKPITLFQVISVNNIKVQLDTPKRRAILNELKNTKTLTEVQKPQIDHIYGTRLNNQWYRVQLKRKIKKEFEVIVIDLGCMIKYVSTLHEVPKHMENSIAMHSLVIHCSLELNEEYYSSKKLRNLAKNDDSNFKMIVLKNNAIGNVHNIYLLLDDKDVATMIIKDNDYDYEK